MKKFILFAAVCVMASVHAMGQIPKPAASPEVQVIYDGQAKELSTTPVFMKKGFDKFERWMLTNVEYPADMEKRQVGGDVQVKVIVQPDGSTVVAEVMKTPGKSFTNAVKQTVERAPKWTPGTVIDPQSGEQVPVGVSYILLVEFKVRQFMGGSMTGKIPEQKNPRTYGSQD